MLENFENVFAPVQKLIELNKAQIEKVVVAQQEASKSFIELTESRIKAASEIKDQESLTAYMQEQVELAQSNYKKIVDDSKSLYADAQAYNEEVAKLFQEAGAQMTAEVKSTMEKATKG